jgi:hypothetical protein
MHHVFGLGRLSVSAQLSSNIFVFMFSFTFFLNCSFLWFQVYPTWQWKGFLLFYEGSPSVWYSSFGSELNSLDDHLCCSSSRHILCILIVLNCYYTELYDTSFRHHIFCVSDCSFRWLCCINVRPVGTCSIHSSVPVKGDRRILSGDNSFRLFCEKVGKPSHE